MLTVICAYVFVLPAFQMILVELVIFRNYSRGLSIKDPQVRKNYALCKREVHPYFVAVYKSVGYFLLGCAISQVSTDISKYLIGRLRPFFLTACMPDYSAFNCTDSRGYMRYVTEDVCTGDEHLIKEARYVVVMSAWLIPTKQP